MTRPSNLPLYVNAPLNEVVLGVQFETPEHYHQAMITDIWNLYRDDYPNVEDQAPLGSSFELFGGKLQGTTPQFQLFDRPGHSRYWFVSEEGCDLVQFQEDRLLLNWRVNGQPEVQYPHFEMLAQKYDRVLTKLDEYFTSQLEEPLKITQFEVSYINHIQITSSPARPDTWFNLFNFGPTQPEVFQAAFAEVLNRPTGESYARFKFDIKTAYTVSSDVWLVTLTVKGRPASPSIRACIEELYNARTLLVERFDKMLTDMAKNAWGRHE